MNGRKDTAGMSAEGGCKSAGRVSVGAARRSMRQRLRAQGVGGAAVSGASRHHSVCVCLYGECSVYYSAIPSGQ